MIPTCKPCAATLISLLWLSKRSITSNPVNTIPKIASRFLVGRVECGAHVRRGPVGASRFEKALGGCVIRENWSSLGSPYAGKSYNVWNASLKRWEQFWVDNTGGMIHYGALRNSVMHFWTDDIPQPDGTKLRRHLQLFSLGHDRCGSSVRDRKMAAKHGAWSTTSSLTCGRLAGYLTPALYMP